MLAALKHAETAVKSEFIIDPACRWFGSAKSVDGGAGEEGEGGLHAESCSLRRQSGCRFRGSAVKREGPPTGKAEDEEAPVSGACWYRYYN